MGTMKSKRTQSYGPKTQTSILYDKNHPALWGYCPILKRHQGGLPKSPWLGLCGRVSVCVFTNDRVAIAAESRVGATAIARALRLPRLLIHCLFLRLQEAALIPQLLAVAHFDPGVPREAPVPTRRRVLAGVVSALEAGLRDLRSGRERHVARDRDAQAEVGRLPGRIRGRVCRLQRGVRGRRRDGAVNHLVVGRQQSGRKQLCVECGEAAACQTLTEIEGELGVVVGLSVRDEVDLVLPALLLEALLGAPVLTDAAARQDNDQSPHQPEPCRKPTTDEPHLKSHLSPEAAGKYQHLKTRGGFPRTAIGQCYCHSDMVPSQTGTESVTSCMLYESIATNSILVVVGWTRLRGFLFKAPTDHNRIIVPQRQLYFSILSCRTEDRLDATGTGLLTPPVFTLHKSDSLTVKYSRASWSDARSRYPRKFPHKAQSSERREVRMGFFLKSSECREVASAACRHTETTMVAYRGSRRSHSRMKGSSESGTVEYLSLA
ncbi:hypothetical protein EYF80_003674 [Liparis tanakae]|uniref:Uncharacterized protein n=1 Tax=Liparis tanakae TaxID=230148 RepID=A0A4Z2J8B3_9TELE|nr:hypothetical protein EYF80_003674 [Liparis tanakae]